MRSLEYWIPAFAGMTSVGKHRRARALRGYFANPSDFSALPLSSSSVFMNSPNFTESR